MRHLQKDLLARAAKIVGGEEMLCARLGVTEQQLSLWMTEGASLPADVSHDLIDVIARVDSARAAPSTEKQGRRRRPKGKLFARRPLDNPAQHKRRS
jgi:hypothetical protein